MLYLIIYCTYSFIADEELGGHEGMMLFVLNEEFKKLNIGKNGICKEKNDVQNLTDLKLGYFFKKNYTVFL